MCYRGKSVLNQKSELRKALEKHKDAQLKKELELKKNESKSLLEKAVEDRAEKIEQVKHVYSLITISKVNLWKCNLDLKIAMAAQRVENMVLVFLKNLPKYVN